VTLADICPGVKVTITAGGQVTCGGVLSTIVTRNEQAGPAPVVQVTIVDPIGNSDLDGGVQVTTPQVPLSVGSA
jgi:hypothetical protein